MAFSDVLDNLISTSGEAFQAYQQNQNPPTLLQPGTYYGPNGQVITANTPITSGNSGLLLLLVVVGVFLFAFMQLRK